MRDSLGCTPMTLVRFLLETSLLAACRSPPADATTTRPARTARSLDSLSQGTRQPCDSPYRCEDWTIETPGFLHGTEPPRFGGSFRSLRDTVVAWFDSAIGHD